MNQLVEMSGKDTVVLIDPVDGGRLVSLVIAGAERILPKARARAVEPALYWGCYPMVPWAGRLSDGRIPTNDGEVRLEPNLPPSAIHGLGFDKSWTIVERSATAVTMMCELRGLGWPFGGRALHTVRMGVKSVELELRLDDYAKPGPAGVGWHPWFTRPPHGDLEVRVDGSEVLVLDGDLAPTGAVRRVTPIEDLRSGPPLGDRRLDHVYVWTKSPAIVRWPDLELRMEHDTTLATVVVYTPAEGICVEPQTMWPNAPLLATAGVRRTGMRTLEPGDAMTAAMRWTWSV
jgi:aldose 1-epimerase